MIRIIANHFDHSVEMEFPENETVLFTKCMEIHVADDFPPIVTAEEVLEPRELSTLVNKEINLDELNFLAKRLDSFTDKEMTQFFTAANYESMSNLKDLINLTFNLDKYTLITDISNMADVGLEYTLNTSGCIDPKEIGSERLAKIGYELLNSNKGVFTPYGLMFKSEKPMSEVYDGKVFPDYAYKDFILSVTISKNGKSESLFLPENALAIRKAAARVGAPEIDSCEFDIECENPNYVLLNDYFADVLKGEGIFELNKLLEVLDETQVDSKKLRAAIDLMNVSTANNIITLAENLDDLEFIEDVSYGDYEAIGRFFVDTDCYEEYEISDDLQGFFNFAEFGEYIAEEKEGEFVPDGFMFYDGVGGMDDLRSQLESEESMTMGGM